MENTTQSQNRPLISKYLWTYTSTGVTQSHTDEANNRKYIYDYDSLGRLTRQEIQTNDTSPTHIGSTEITYDIRNNVTKIAAEFGGQTKVDEYLYEKSSGNANAASYAQDNLVSRYKINGSNVRYVDYTYDALNRLTKQSLALNGTALLSKYSYYDSKRDEPYTTTQLETETLDNTVYKYYYDYVGNITRITKDSNEYRSYEYDNKNQLTRENNNTTKETIVYTYDDLGNIATKTKYAYTTSSTLDTAKETITYNYGKDSSTGWNHILTGITNGSSTTENIVYDEIGNPTTYLGASLTWSGRELTGYKKDTSDIKYTYDADGLRATKTVTKNDIETKHNYHYVSGQLRYEERGNAKLYYFYDASGNLSSIHYYAPGVVAGYYVLTNSRGDVIALYDGNGNCVVEYEYDAWGNCKITKDTEGIGALNPIRYRGYYYDTETELYYLQSRYYNPQVGRFLNADSQIAGVGGDVNGYNMFSYCMNNPVNMSDPTGHWPKSLKELGSSLANSIKTFARICISPLKAISAELGGGSGVGLKGGFSVNGVPIEAGFISSISDSISYSNGKFDIRNTSSTQIGINIAEIFDFSYREGFSHSYFDENCNCSFGYSSYKEKSACVANKKISESNSGLGVSAGIYCGLGFEASVYIDFEAWGYELLDIYNDCATYDKQHRR